MNTLSILNLKGGVGKTITAINMSVILATEHKRRVLLIDNDKQGNTSKFFGRYDYDMPSITDVLLVEGYDIRDAIRGTTIAGLDVLPANMDLMRVNTEIMMDFGRSPQTRLRDALARVEADYDFVVIDNPPDLGINVYNALAASDDLLIPIKIDSFAFDGVDQAIDAVRKIRAINPKLRIAGGVVTMLQRTRVNAQGERMLKSREDLPMFDTVIRKTSKVDETTFVGVPLVQYGSNITAAEDYRALVKEYVTIKELW